MSDAKSDARSLYGFFFGEGNKVEHQESERRSHPRPSLSAFVIGSDYGYVVQRIMRRRQVHASTQRGMAADDTSFFKSVSSTPPPAIPLRICDFAFPLPTTKTKITKPLSQAMSRGGKLAPEVNRYVTHFFVRVEGHC